MSLSAENLNNASEQSDAEESSTRNDRISLEVIEERIRANLKHVNEQMANLSQSLNQLINDNSVKTTSTADSHAHYPHSRCSHDSHQVLPLMTNLKQLLLEKFGSLLKFDRVSICI